MYSVIILSLRKEAKVKHLKVAFSNTVQTWIRSGYKRAYGYVLKNEY